MIQIMSGVLRLFGPDLRPDCLRWLSADDKSRRKQVRDHEKVN